MKLKVLFHLFGSNPASTAIGISKSKFRLLNLMAMFFLLMLLCFVLNDKDDISDLH